MKVLILILTVLSLSGYVVQAEPDPYLVYGETYEGGELVGEVEVTVVYDRIGEKYVVISDYSGYYAIILTNATEGDTYTVSAEGFEETGRIIKWDSEGYQRMGDEVDVRVPTEEAESPYVIPFLLGVIVVLLVVTAYVVRRDVKG